MPPALIGQVIDYYIEEAGVGPRGDELFAAIICALGDFPDVCAQVRPTEPRSAIVVVEKEDAASLTGLVPDAVRVATRTRRYAAFVVRAGSTRP